MTLTHHASADGGRPSPMPLFVTVAHVPNPDFPGGYHHGRPAERGRIRRVACAGLADASRICREFIARNELGSGNWTGGQITDATGKPIARVSFNGRVWDAAGWPVEVA